MEILEIAGSLGVGCFLAVIIFFMYRRECKNHREQMRELLDKQRQDRVFMEDRLTKLLEDDQKTRADHTKALTELTTLLLRMNGKSK